MVRIPASWSGLDFACHPGVSVWKDPDALLLNDIFYTVLDVEEDRLGVCLSRS